MPDPKAKRQIIPRRPPPMGGAKPTRDDLPQFFNDNPNAVDDILPTDNAALRLLIVGVNPGLWTAAVNAPFARPGNRFWPSIHQAGLSDYQIDASRGLSTADAMQFISRGIGLTNLVGRATVRADQLSKAELREAGQELIARVNELHPKMVAIAGITAFRDAFALPKATLGAQDTTQIPGWPSSTKLWVVPQPSGLNAHFQIPQLAEIWREVWQQSAS